MQKVFFVCKPITRIFVIMTTLSLSSLYIKLGAATVTINTIFVWSCLTWNIIQKHQYIFYIYFGLAVYTYTYYNKNVIFPDR